MTRAVTVPTGTSGTGSGMPDIAFGSGIWPPRDCACDGGTRTRDDANENDEDAVLHHAPLSFAPQLLQNRASGSFVGAAARTPRHDWP